MQYCVQGAWGVIPAHLTEMSPDVAVRFVAPVADELLPGVPVGTVARAVGAWTTVVGAISLEVFGHWRNTVWEPGLLFEAALREAARSIGL